MSIVGRMIPQRSNVAMSEPFWRDFIPMSTSGKAVNANTALSVVTVFDCLRVLGEGVAQVPFKVFKDRPGGGKDVAAEHPAYRLVYRRPNSWQTSFEFRENMVFQAGLLGNFYCYKNIVAGKLRELVPFPPGTVTPREDERVNRLVYDVIFANGECRTLPPELIWHLRGPSWDTKIGMQAVSLAREAIGLSLATEESHALLHANGGQTTGLYSISGTLDSKGHADLSMWVDKHITGANRFRPLVLDREAKFMPTAMTGVDSQHIETRKFQIEEICRSFRVMPIMVGAAEKTATYASSEQMFLAHVVHTLSPWYERIEQSADINLLTKQEQDQGYYFKFIPNALMRGASKDRAEFLYKMWQMKAINSNEIRELEEMNPYPGGEEFYIAQGMNKEAENEEEINS